MDPSRMAPNSSKIDFSFRRGSLKLCWLVLQGFAGGPDLDSEGRGKDSHSLPAPTRTSSSRSGPPDSTMPGSRFALARQQSEGLSAPPLPTHASAALSTCEGCLPFFVLPSRRKQYHRRWHGGRGLVNHRLMQIIGKASWGPRRQRAQEKPEGRPGPGGPGHLKMGRPSKGA